MGSVLPLKNQYLKCGAKHLHRDFSTIASVYTFPTDDFSDSILFFVTSCLGGLAYIDWWSVDADTFFSAACPIGSNSKFTIFL